MSKTVGYVLTAALVVFAIAVPIIGPTALAAWGFSAGTVAAIGAALSAAVIVNSLLMPKPKSSNNAQETTLQLGEVARRALFGKSATAGSLVDVFNYGGKYGTDHEVVIFALADHYCEELVGVYVNDVFVPWVGDGNYAQFDTHHLSMYFRNGSESQTLPSVVTTSGPGWTSSDTGAGICYAVVDYLADSPTAKHPAWPGGRPTFLWVVKGKRCYDPRLDTTIGGSGSHLWQDPSTWEWSENPIVCHYNYERGIYACDRVDQPNMLLVGRGLSATEVPPANIFANASLCDEVMDDTLARYTIGGIVAADEKFLDVAEKFAAACGGIIIQPEGSVEIEPAQARTPSFAFTDDDLLVGSTVEWNEGILSEANSEWLNTIVPKYVAPDQKWGDHTAPVRRVDEDLIIDGGSREEDVVLQLVTVERQASDIGEIHRKLGRLFGRASVVLPPAFAEIEEGDWGTWTSARRFGGDTKTFRVENYALDGKWQNALQLREINSAVYDGVLGEGSSAGTSGTWDTTTPPIDIGTPDSGNWTLAPVTLTDAGVSTGALELTGDSTDDGSAEAIIVETWPDDGAGGIDPVANPDDPPWSVFGSFPPSATKIDITGLLGGTAYYVAVTYVVSGIYGDRLVLGPQTVPATDVSGAVNPLIDAKLAAIAWKQPVRAKTTAALAANTYANGSSGVGATLTGNANGALAAQDGVTLVATERLLVANEATGSHNGIYVVTQVGDGSHPYILTRATDADAPAELVNATVKVSEGTVAADQEWQCTTNGTITVGSTALVWASGGPITTSGYTMNTGKLLGRTTASTGAIEEITPGAGLAYSGGVLAITGGSGGVGMSFVASATVGGAAATTLTVSGLDLNADGRWFVMLTLKNATTSASNISLYYNSDTTAANYDRQSLTANSTSITGTRGNDAVVGALDSNAASTGSGNLMTQMWISNDLDGRPIANAVSGRTGNSNILIQSFTHEWRTAGTNVTGITISSAVASSIAVGSKIEVWKMPT